MSKRSSADSGDAELAASDPLDEDESGALPAESIGRYLTQQRRLRGISVAQLAEMTRIPVRSLERLEAGHFDHDIDGFVRGFVRTVSLALGLDPEDALARMLSEPGGEPDAGRPLGLLFARSLVGLFAVALLALAFGVVRSVIQGDGTSPPGVSASPVVWRSDPVRALAEANAAQGGGPAADSPAARQTGPAAASPPAARQTGPAADSPAARQTGPAADSPAARQTGPAADSPAARQTGPAAASPAAAAPPVE